MTTLTRKLALVACWAFLSLSYSASTNAQQIAGTVDPTNQTTGNLINNNNWSGIGARAPDPNNCCSNPAGSQPLYNTTNNTIMFSYGQATVQQSIAVNQALSSAGVGVQVNGYSWAYDVRNMNGHGNQSGVDSLTVNSWLKNTAGQSVLSTAVTYNTKFDWTSFSGTQILGAPVAPTTLSTVGISFSGKDSGYWAGLYGPEVRNVDLRLHYGVDPCQTNPAYGPQCAGFDKIVDSANLVPNPNGYAVFGDSINQSFAINQALSASGSGITVHGFKWGYVANANGPYCAFWLLGCWDERTPSITTNVNITSNTGASLYSVERTYTNSYNTTSYSYLFPASRPVTTLGNFNFTATTNDSAYVGQMWSKAIYTPDPCVQDPLSSPTCPGYAKAMLAQLASTTTTTSTTDTTSTTATTTTTSSTTPVTTATIVDVAQPTTVTTTTVTTTASSSSSSTPTTTVTPTANNPQPKVGEVSVAGSAAKTTMSTSQLLAIVKSEQSRVSALETATATSATSQVQQQSDRVAADAQTVMSAAGTSSTTSTVSSSSNANVGLSVNLSAKTSVVSIGGLRTPDLYSISSASQQSFSVASINSVVSYSLRQNQDLGRMQTEEGIKSEGMKFTGANNLLNNQQSTMILQSNFTESKGSSVNRNVKDNDAAGGVSLASIATQPTGYNLYMNGLQDAPFYAPKEIYRNQKVVDNARAQRLLSGSSDRLHQQMVDQQYNRGN